MVQEFTEAKQQVNGGNVMSKAKWWVEQYSAENTRSSFQWKYQVIPLSEQIFFNGSGIFQQDYVSCLSAQTV